MLKKAFEYDQNYIYAPSTANLTLTRSNYMLGCFQGMQQLITNMLLVTMGHSWVLVNLSAQPNQKILGLDLSGFHSFPKRFRFGSHETNFFFSFFFIEKKEIYLKFSLSFFNLYF